MPRHLVFMCPVVLALLSAIAPSSKAQGDALPKGILWNQSPYEDSQVDPAALNTLYDDTEKEQHHDLKGIVIVRNGALVSEHYFDGDSSTTLHDIRSTTKSLTSLLMGIAIDKKIIQRVDDPIALTFLDSPKTARKRSRLKTCLGR